MNTCSGIRLAVVSDIHYASDAEQARRHTHLDAITSRWRRALVRCYRHVIWDRDPFDHNHLLDRFLDEAGAADLVIANGDFSCDTAYLGVSDDAAFASAQECLDKLRARFGLRLHAVFGDHEIGKKMLAEDHGGLRLASYHRAAGELGIEPFWQVRLGRRVLLGVVSTLLALPVYEAEALADEVAQWRQLRAEHLECIREALETMRTDDRWILFCHDPTALPFLGKEPAVQRRLGQLECTIIGHLHSPFYLWQARLLAGLPAFERCGHSIRRMMLGVRNARAWKPFNVVLCPSLAGIQLLKDGGFLSATLTERDLNGAMFRRHRFPASTRSRVLVHSHCL